MSADYREEQLRMIRKGAEEAAATAKAEAERKRLEESRKTLDSWDWRAGLTRRNNRIIGDERNTLLALKLAPELRGLVRFNSFALRVEFTRTTPWREVAAGAIWTDDDDLSLQAWLQDRDIEVRQRGVVADSVAVVSKEYAYHPVQQYLRDLKWDGTKRVDDWLARWCGSTEDKDYLRAIGSKFLISAVARVMRDGCQVDHTLVIEGPQGIGKSTVARILALEPAWFADDIPDLGNKDSAMQLCGKWIIELAELAAMRRPEVERVKAFLTRTHDVYRPPFGRRTVTVARQSVFIATTNEAQYLRDATGNRRFWPTRCTRIDADAIRANVHQLWAEALNRYDLGQQWHLDPKEIPLATAEQHDRQLVTELESDVAEYLGLLAGQNITQVTARQVFTDALRLEPSDRMFADTCRRLGAEVAAAIHRAGWRRLRVTGRGETRRTVYGLPHRDS